MKKLILSAFVFTAIFYFTNHTYSQNQDIMDVVYKRYSLGLFMGINFEQFSASGSSQDLFSGMGYQGGLFLEKGWNRYLSTQTELFYIKRETKDIKINHYLYDASADYLDLDLLVKGKFGTHRFNIFAFGGPFLGFLLSSTVKHISENADTALPVSSLNYGFYFGVGFEFFISINNSFFTEFRYELGSANLNKNSYPSVSTQGFSWTLFGFKFGL